MNTHAVDVRRASHAATRAAWEAGYWAATTTSCDDCRSTRRADRHNRQRQDPFWPADRNCATHAERLAHAEQAERDADAALTAALGR